MVAVKVDVSEKQKHKEIIYEFGVKRLPNIVFVGGGLIKEYKGKKSTLALVGWCKVSVHHLSARPCDDA